MNKGALIAAAAVVLLLAGYFAVVSPDGGTATSPTAGEATIEPSAGEGVADAGTDGTAADPLQSAVDDAVAGAAEYFTVEGYDPVEVQTVLEASSMSEDARNEYLARLETASGAELDAILTELRLQLNLPAN